MKPNSYSVLLIALLAGLAGSGGALGQEDFSAHAPGQAEAAPVKPAAKPPHKTAPHKAAAMKVPVPSTMAQAQQAVPVLPSAPPQQLPNGASSITESYGDWTVTCRIDNGQKLCALAQAQGNKQTGQRLFAIEMLAPKNGQINGTILMPFGVKLEAGATLKHDGKDLGQTLHYSTCVSDGCLLPVSFAVAAVEAMKKGTTLEVTSLNLANEQAITFSVSLNGFPAGLKRVIDLAGSEPAVHLLLSAPQDVAVVL